MIERLLALAPSPSPSPSPFRLNETGFTLLVGTMIIGAIGLWILSNVLRRSSNKD